jgi:hypothetical protein
MENQVNEAIAVLRGLPEDHQAAIARSILDFAAGDDEIY